MKKLLSILLLTVILFGTFSFSTIAQSQENVETNGKIVSTDVLHFNDGSYITITVLDTTLNSSLRSTYTKSGTKTYTMVNSSGDVLWKFTVKGTFSVNSGVSATCTSTSYSTSSLASGWSLKSGSSYASGNKAIGDGTFEHKVLFIVTDTKSCHVVLTCDSNGNLS